MRGGGERALTNRAIWTPVVLINMKSENFACRSVLKKLKHERNNILILIPPNSTSSHS
jgi:hypothetical protein